MAATSTPSRPGRLPNLTKYEVLEELGHGGMATVYRAHDKRLGRDVALKVIHPHLRDSAEVAHRFFVEAKAVAKLRHANIVEVYDVSGEGEPEQYLVVELLRGKTLRKLLQEEKLIPPEAAAALALELLSALAHAHGAGVVHRDVKPENVILEHHAMPSTPTLDATEGEDGAIRTPNPRPISQETPGDRVIIKLTDFGIAKLLDAQGVTSTGQVLGSPAHMAPEQIEGGDVDARADVFALGVLLYECMVGHLPFEGNNPAQVLRRVLDGIYPSAERERPEIGKTWSVILDQALAHKPEDRFVDATAMREALLAELKRLDILSPRAELEAWFDSPEAFTARHKNRMIKKLCELGGVARKAHQVLVAASDYNRALAYAPDDPALLRVVSTMHRAEARARLARRLAPMVLAALAMGVAAFFVTSFLRQHPIADPKNPVPAVSAAEVHPNPPPSSPTAVVSAPPRSSAPIPAVVLPPVIKSAAPPQQVRREIQFAKVRPQGVRVAVDGDGAIDPDTQSLLTVDDKEHKLTFTCVGDLCVPVDRIVVAGDQNVTIEVELKIRPAKLLVEGNAARRYTVKERPGITLRAGQSAEIAMKRGTDRFTVVELETNREAIVDLKVGQEAKVTFADAP